MWFKLLKLGHAFLPTVYLVTFTLFGFLGWYYWALLLAIVVAAIWLTIACRKLLAQNQSKIAKTSIPETSSIQVKDTFYNANSDLVYLKLHN
jgi:hypothetical protein